MRSKLLWGIVITLALLAWACPDNGDKPPGTGDGDRGVTLGQVVGLTVDGKIPTGEEVTFRFQLDNDTDDDILKFTNGFRVYWEDEEVDWGIPSGDYANDITLNYTDALGTITVWSDDVQDTVGFQMLFNASNMYPAGWNLYAMEVTVGPIDPAMAGGRICIDSCSYFPPSGGDLLEWSWEYEAEVRKDVDWDGPHCYEIEVIEVPEEEYDVFLDHVSAEDPGTVESLPTGKTITFHISIRNTSGYIINGFTHGFAIYAEDESQPVDWGAASGIMTADLTSLYPADFLFKHERTTHAIDTVGFSGAGGSGEGVPVDDVVPAFEISIGPLDASDAGKRICINSVETYETSPDVYLPWMWSFGSDADSDYDVSWSGPHCFTIEEP